MSRSGSDGQAFNFVWAVLEASNKTKGMEALAEDDLFFFAHTLIEQLDNYSCQDLPSEGEERNY